MVSEVAARVLNRAPAELVGQRLSRRLSGTSREQFDGYKEALEAGTTYTSTMQFPGLENRWFSVSATGFGAEGLVIIVRDVTLERGRDELVDRLRERQEILEREALLDPLTGLGNRLLVTSRLEHALERLDRQRSSVAVMFIDLDGFKPINDRHGHAAGDRLLIEIGHRLRSVARRYDTIGRFGGDEFVVVCEDISATGDIALVAERFVALCALPIHIGDLRLEITASVGIAVSDSSSSSPSELIDKADIAMYRAKYGGGNGVEFFDPTLHATAGHHPSVTSREADGLDT
jgi:diguanylate cyclase (GGDEF)-like protein